MMGAMRLPAIGELFEQKYLIRDALGEGGFATVFRASDVEIQRDVAIKILAPRDGEYGAGVRARFMVEARIIAGLQDSHTIRLFEFGESTTGLLYMVFQYVSGEDLATFLHRRGAPAPEVAVHIAIQVLHALAEAHAINVLHRDIKPGNILVHGYMGDEFAVKLLDFGIAKLDDAVGGLSLTKTGARVGTPRYMSPEQAFSEALTARSDIYSLGLVLFEMLVGRKAREGGPKEILEQQVAHRQIVLPPDVAWPTLRAVVERMLAPEVAQRFGSATEVIGALEFALSNHVAPARPAPPISAVRAPSSSQVVAVRRDDSTVVSVRRGRWVLAVALALCAVVAALALTMSKATSNAPRPTVAELPAELLKLRQVPPEPRPVVVDARPDAGARRSDAASVAVAAEPDGCGLSYEIASERWFDLGFAGRRVRVFLPTPYDPQVRYPLILAFVPKYLSEHQYAKAAGLVDLTQNEPVIVLTPTADQPIDPWDSPSDLETAQRTIVGASERFCVDRSRVFTIGHHHGGRMARDAACDLGVSGVVFTGWAERPRSTYCRIDQAVPTMWVAGRHDDMLPLAGGEGCTAGPFYPADEHDEIWKARNRCGDAERTWSRTKTSLCTTWDCDVVYVSCRADGGHHLDHSRWSLMYPFCDNRVLEFDVGAEAWKFFREEGRILTPDEQRITLKR